MKENLGVLLAVSSLPSRHGIGDFGKDSFKFIDWCKQNNYKYWQILPLNPVGPGNSPYSSTCSFAIDYRYISLDLLKAMKLLPKVPDFEAGTNMVNFEDVQAFKRKWLLKAYKKYMKGNQKELKAFIKANPWVLIFGTFSIFKIVNNDKPWNEWKIYYRDYFKRHKNIPLKYKDEIYFEIFMQWIAQKQWLDILAYARKKGVKIIADMPFYVGTDSIDVWIHRDQFLFDENCNQLFEGGCPPDAFSDIGQKWGSPIYDFEKMKQDGYDLMITRTGFLAEMCDYLRLDHFRAFDTYYVIPAGMPDAKIGEWKIGPRTDFFDTLFKRYPNINLIAEDLGDLFDSVLELRDHYNFPGMFIEEFTIFDVNNSSNDNLIVYPGTHDNETLLGWYKNLERHHIDFLKWRLNCNDEEHLFDAIFYYILSVPSKMTILPMQDILKLDNAARMNVPGTVGYPNFAWKLEDWSFVDKVYFRNK